MQYAQTLVTHYLEAFNETDADRRRELAEALYTPDCTYTDPHVELRGVDQVAASARRLKSASPGSRSHSAARSTHITTRPGFNGTPALPRRLTHTSTLT